MADEQPPPGPNAARAYRLGMVAGGVVGFVVIGALYWTGALTPLTLGYVLVALFPVYLIGVATVLILITLVSSHRSPATGVAIGGKQ